MLKRTPSFIVHPTPNPMTPLPLNTGATIPALGFGTWQAKPGEAKAAVAHAIRSGYRHIDTAFVYGNEKEVGAAINEAITEGAVKREDLFVTTKLWCTYHGRVEENLNMSLENLGLKYLDLYLMHWPVAMNPNGNSPTFPKHSDGTRDILTDWSYKTTWQNMEKLPATGKVKAIGVANFSKAYLEELLKNASIVPAADQIENHPQLPQQEIVDFCKEKGIHVTGYSPLGSTGSPLFNLDEVKQLAEKYSVGPGTILLSWHLARGSSVLPKSVTPSRIEENMKLIELEKEDVELLDGIQAKHGLKRYVFPPFGTTMGFPDTKATT